ncbi:MAG TPA: hypothetical protein VF587_10860, partial [Solirubrobacteraceae bacterium]
MDKAARVAEAARDAVAGTFESFAPGIADVPPAELLGEGADALSGAEAPAVLVHAVPADGLTGPVAIVL